MQKLLGDPNAFAYLALILWAPLSILVCKRLRPSLAVAVLLIGAVMFLPELVKFDLPLLPPFDKLSVANLWALIGCMFVCPDRLRAARPGRGIDVFILILMASSIGNTLSNEAPLVYGPTTLPGLTMYDGFALSVKDLLRFGIPFFLGRAIYRTPRDLLDFLKVLALGGLVYTMLCLVEIRLSPQLHNWVYGFHQHSFLQTMRFGGYRPTVFMAHGLAVAMFVLSALLAAVGLARVRESVIGLPASIVAPWLAFVFALCKSMGAFVYAIACVPLLLVANPKRAVQLGAVLAGLVVLYPVLRATDTFPTETLVLWAERVSEDRASSLEDRFEQETQLVERAQERIWFGWGAYGRNRVWDEKTGRDLSVTDGAWIIDLGSRGAIGFLAQYSLLVIPLFGAARGLSRLRVERDRRLVGTLALISALMAVDLLPNGLYSYLPYLMAGVLMGVVPGIARTHALLARRREQEHQELAAQLSA